MSTSQSWNGPTTQHRHDKDQRIVKTPYGRGLCVTTRDSQHHKNEPMREIHLLDWDPLLTKAPQKQPTLYSVVDYPSVRPMVGDDVICSYGRGRVVSILANNHTCVVKLTSWRLAGRSLVTCHLSLDAVRVVRKKTLQEMDAHERVFLAQTKKAQATKLFGAKLYSKALVTYATAVEAIRYVQHDGNSNNELRADLLVVMITCCNNAATCSIQLAKWDDAIKFAKNALVLLDALHGKRGLKIHSILNKDGYSDAKLFGEWRVKSFLLLGNALLEKREYHDAMVNLKAAQELIAEYSASSAEDACQKNLKSQEKHRKKLCNTVIQQRKADKQKEKEAAIAMFGKNETTPKPKSTAAETTPKSEALPPTVPHGSPSSVIDIKGTTGVEGILRRKPSEHDQPLDEGSENVEKKVSFSDDEQEEPWYEEHKEALILMAAACGLATVSIILLRSRK